VAEGEIVGAAHEAAEDEAEVEAHWQEAPCLRCQPLQKHHHPQAGVEAEGEEVVREEEAAEAAGSLLLKALRYTKSALTATTI
jgi:methylphosphotriester-DNA--protein-cysteine methyltransferase